MLEGGGGSHVGAFPSPHQGQNKGNKERPPPGAEQQQHNVGQQQQFYHPPHLPQPQNPFQSFHRPQHAPMQSLPSFIHPHTQMEEEGGPAPSAPQEADNNVGPHPNARPFLQDNLYYVQKLQKPQPFVPSPGAPPQVNPATPPREVAPSDVGDASQANKQTPNQKEMLGLYTGRGGFSDRPMSDKNGKRKRSDGVEQAEEVRKERHNMAEKKRRSDMNDAIERLRALLPQQVTSDKRLTKVEVLIEAADHLTQVQNLCAKLIAENNGLMKGGGGVVVMPPGGAPPVAEEVRRGPPQNEPRRRGDEDDEDEESEEEENEAEEDEYRRKEMAQRMSKQETGQVPPDYAQMHHHTNRNGHGEMMDHDKSAQEGAVLSEDGGRSGDTTQLPLQQPPQPQQMQMPPQHQEGDRP